MMTNLFTRIKNSIASDLHEILDKKEQKNPIAVLNQYLRECERETEKVRKLIERQHLLKDEFSREYRSAKAIADKRKYQAEIAQKAGEVDLYEFAHSEYVQYEERASRLQEARKVAEEQLEQLERKYAEMQHKLKDMHLKRMELMGRENIARAHYQMNKLLDNNIYNANYSFSRFSEIENYLERLEHQVNSSYYRNTIDAKIAQLEKNVKNEENHSNL